MALRSIRRKFIQILIALLLVTGAGIKFFLYGDFRLSVANADTASYIVSSRTPLFSWKMFAGIRMLTTNLIYKLANDPAACPLAEISNPSIGIEVPRQKSPCFAKITLLQNIISILAWSVFAWTTARWLENPLLKILSVILILVFAYTPQIAEWDYVLSPESLTFSLLVLSFALMEEVAFRIARDKILLRSASTIILICAWAVVYFFWLFIRDVHLYTVLITAGLLLVLWILRQLRESKTVMILLLLLAGIFILGWKSAKDSLRATHDPLLHSFQAYIFPYPARVEYMKGYGMPELDAPEFQNWLDAQATRTFGLFLLSHPGFVFQTLWDSLPYFELDFGQPYFTTHEIRFQADLFRIGQMVHPETMAVYVIDALILLAFVAKLIRRRTASSLAWTWLAAWFFLCAMITLLPSFFGDTVGTRRHIAPSVEMFRLFLWIFLLPHFEDEPSGTAE